jgi:alkylation response protein AidB-like acyl-CoA dehydrogenase
VHHVKRRAASGDVASRGVTVAVDAVFPAWTGGERPSSNGPVSQFIQAAVDRGIACGAFDETIRVVRTRSRPWIDSGRDRASEDALTIREVGQLVVALRAAEAPLARAGRTIDAILDDPTEAEAPETAVAEAKVLTTEIALSTTNTLHECPGTRSVLAEDNLDRHWRNARTHILQDPVRGKPFHGGNHVLNGVAPRGMRGVDRSGAGRSDHATAQATPRPALSRSP